MQWLAVAFIAPILWAIVSVIDNYFVEDIYEDEFDGILISAFFQLLPWLFVALGIVNLSIVWPAVPWAIGSGFLFLASLFFYFRGLFRVNDSALMQILWSLSVPIVPFLAWILLREQLKLLHYLGMMIAFLGVLLFNFDIQKGAKERLAKVAFSMTWAVVFMASSMVFGRKAFVLSDSLETNFLFFCAGAVLILILSPLFDSKKPLKRLSRIWILTKKYYPIFIVAESLSVIATLFSQWATKIAPAVSFIALIESLVPVFVVVLSLMLVVLVRFRKNDALQRIYQEQLTHMGVKVVATIIIAIGIFSVASTST